MTYLFGISQNDVSLNVPLYSLCLTLVQGRCFEQGIVIWF